MTCYGLRVGTCVLSDGSITLPEQIRTQLRLQPFDSLAFTIENGVIVASKVKEASEQYEPAQ